MSLSLILSRLRELRLGAMAQALERQLEQPGTYDDLSFTERMGLLVDFLPFIKQNLYTYSGFVFFKETSSSFEFLHQAASA